MAGIYIHIPFCKQACSYCNFHFSTSFKLRTPVLDAMATELTRRSDFLDGLRITSVYFGGGTPSLLTSDELLHLWDVITEYFAIAPDAEITLEANPDDLTGTKVRELTRSPVNRLSIGIQSFHDPDLRYMRRAHNAKEAYAVLSTAMSAGFESLTADLIYGTPTLEMDRWEENLRTIADMDVPHLSAYQLTVEPRTALHKHIALGKVPAPDEEKTYRQFMMLMDWAERSGYEHYEISNFAKAGFRAVHNSNYWKGAPYIGIGPSAHSFDGHSRHWNVANNARYIALIKQGDAIDGCETLTERDKYNEYVMTHLRIREGVNIERLDDMGPEFSAYFQNATLSHLENGNILRKESNYILSTRGKCFADRIAADCFIAGDE